MKSWLLGFFTFFTLAAASLCGASDSYMACKDCNLGCEHCKPQKSPLMLASIMQGSGKDVAHQYDIISTQGLKSLIDSGQKVIILDAREPGYQGDGKIPGAIFLTDSANAQQVSQVIPSKEQLVITYCSGVQCPASEWLADYLVGLGYKNVKRYSEGIEGWTKAGNKIEKTN